MPYDGEVMRLSAQNTVIQWSAAMQAEYDCGESLNDWGVHNLTVSEAKRIGVSEDELNHAIEEHIHGRYVYLDRFALCGGC